MKRIIIIGIICSFSILASGQSLLDMLDSLPPTEKQPIAGTFSAVRLINGYTTETAGHGDLVFSISHRFGSVKGGAYELWGLDESSIRFGFEYGITPRLSVGLGRSNYQKLYDGFLKYQFVQQKTSGGSPITITGMANMAVKTEKWLYPEYNWPNSARMYYTWSMLIGRKFNSHFSAQLVPVVLHRNMVEIPEEQNTLGAIGAGGKYSFNHWLSAVAEYYYLLPGYTADHYNNSLSLGVDMQSGGGHVFQVHITNSRGMAEKVFIPETTGSWRDGDVSIGFNIIRIFHLKKNKTP